MQAAVLIATTQPHAQAFDSLELTDEKINAITDKIPQRPVGVVEGTSYTAVILAAFGVRGQREGGGSKPGFVRFKISRRWSCAAAWSVDVAWRRSYAGMPGSV